MSKIHWQLDAVHSEITFRVRHLMVSNVSGKFSKFNSTVQTDDDQFTHASISFDIDAASLDTGMEQRDNHLRSEEFFSTQAFPKISFKSSALRSMGDGNFQLDGDLTIRNVTKPITFEVEFGGVVKDPYGNTKAGFEVSGKINRKVFGLTWNALTEAGGAVVGDEVKIVANVQYAMAQPQA